VKLEGFAPYSALLKIRSNAEEKNIAEQGRAAKKQQQQHTVAAS
jgi:hypothetical protein